MENKSEPEKTKAKLLKIMLPEELLERVQSYCNEKKHDDSGICNRCYH